MACCDDCAKTGERCGEKKMLNMQRRPTNRLTRGMGDTVASCFAIGQVYDNVTGRCVSASETRPRWACPPGQVYNGSICVNGNGSNNSNPSGWSGTVAQLGSGVLALLQQRQAQGNNQPFVTNINGRAYQVSADGTARDLGAAAGGALGTLGAGISAFVQQNTGLVLIGGAALVLLFMKPPSRRR